jgi:predicted acylesterase/phospholipase RssA
MKKKVIFILVFSIFLITGFILFDSRKNESVVGPLMVERQGTAILMTGAAARIPQEAALLEELYKRGKLKDIVFISGVSSGALNAVILNGILSGKMTWAEYRKILFNLTNSDIYIQNGKKLPFNTEPARELYKKVVEDRLGYYRIGDLPYVTAISFTNLKDLVLKKRVYRMCSRKINVETDTTLSLVDIMMASSSFPVAFPPVRIRNVSTIPDVEYIDGGVGEDHVPYQALLDFEKFRGKGVERVYIISRKSDSIPEVGKEFANLGLKDRKIFDRLGVSLENILKKDIIKRLVAFEKEAPELSQRTYIWIPDFKKDFFLLNFNNLQEQYIATQQWARTHNPVPLEQYLLPYKRNEKNLRNLLLRPFPVQ